MRRVGLHTYVREASACVARSTTMGNAKASTSETSNK